MSLSQHAILPHLNILVLPSCAVVRLHSSATSVLAVIELCCLQKREVFISSTTCLPWARKMLNISNRSCAVSQGLQSGKGLATGLLLLLLPVDQPAMICWLLAMNLMSPSLSCVAGSVSDTSLVALWQTQTDQQSGEKVSHAGRGKRQDEEEKEAAGELCCRRVKPQTNSITVAAFSPCSCRTVAAVLLVILLFLAGLQVI
jgi:hypothetical protein